MFNLIRSLKPIVDAQRRLLPDLPIRGSWRRWNVRGQRLLLVVLVTTVLFIVMTSAAVATLAIIDAPAVRLEGGLVQGVVVLFGATLIGAALWVRYARASRPGMRATGGTMVGIGVVTLRVALLTIAGVSIGVAALNPIGGTKVFVLADSYSLASWGYQREMLEELVLATESAKGRDVQFDSAEIERIVRDAAANGVSDAGAAALLRAVERIDPVNARLEQTARLVGDRVGDVVYVVSAHRNPDESVRGWPLDPRRVGSVWRNVNTSVDLATVDRPRILYYSILHDPAFRPLLDIELMVPESYPVPALDITVTERGSVILQKRIQPPPRSADWTRAAVDETVHFGRLGEQISYRIELPKRGDELSVKFTDPNGVWDASAEVPRFGGRPFELSPRSLDAAVSDAALTALTRLSGLEPSTGNGDAPPLVIGASRPDADVILHLGEMAAAPGPGESVVEIIQSSGPVDGGYHLVRTAEYLETPIGGVWVDMARAAGFSDLGAHVALDADARPLVIAQRGHALGGPVVFQRDPVHRPGYVTVVVPPLTELDTLTTDKQRTIAHLIVWAASLAERAGDGRAPAFSERLVAPADLVALPMEAGREPSASPLWREIFQALFGALDDRRAFTPANRITRDVLSIGLAAIAFIIALGVPVAAVSLWKQHAARHA